MGNALLAPKWNVDDFLAWEATQAERHEFWHGETFAMVGARRVHNVVAGNLFAFLKAHLRGSPCGVFIEGVKVQLADDTVVYPDVFVSCDPADLRADLVLRAPSLVVEVLSPSTEAFDRGAKFAGYRQLPSLREYLLIDPDTREVLLFRRASAQDLFTLHDFTATPALELASVAAQVPLDVLFEGLSPPGDALAEPAPDQPSESGQTG